MLQVSRADDRSEEKKPPGDGTERAEIGVLSPESLPDEVEGMVKPREGRETSCISPVNCG
jgi:hypothetical protein